MNKTIEIVKIVASGDAIHYEVHDNTGLQLLKNEVTKAWVKYHNVESFGFTPEDLPESILSIPIALYLMPVTWFYGVDLVVPSLDKSLYDSFSNIYEAYSNIYGPFKKEWCGNVIVKTVEGNKALENRFDNIVFFSGGVDAVHAGINHTGDRNVLVTVPSIEAMGKSTGRQNFYEAKTGLIRDFAAVSRCDWMMITNDFQQDVFDDIRIQNDLRDVFALNGAGFLFDGWFGLKYLGNLLSSAPFAYAMGVKNLIMGSSFECLENVPYFNRDGSSPELTNSFKFANVSFAEQDALFTRRSQKVMNIVKWFNSRKERTQIRVCFRDSTVQCGVCLKCIRTELNLLCAGESPANWGFANFNEKRFSKLICSYKYRETNPCWVWDIVDSIDENKNYPCCNSMLHWLKRVGYKKYYKRAEQLPKIMRIFNFKEYPHYIKVLISRNRKR